MIWSPKDPASVEHFAFDFSLLLETGDTLASIVAITIDSGDSLLTVGGVTLSGLALVVCTLSGGTLDTTYVLRAEALTTGGERLELSGNLLIRRPVY